jgi:hypothetical protein
VQDGKYVNTEQLIVSTKNASTAHVPVIFGNVANDGASFSTYPNLPYFRYHGADMPWVFGNINPIRDPNDLYSVQLVSGYFAEFVKSGQPKVLSVATRWETLKESRVILPVE